MIHGPSPTRTRLADHIQQLAAFAPTAFPVLSLYLDLMPNRHQHERDIAYVRAALAERVASLHPQAPERASLERDVARIEIHLRDEVSPSASGLAIFACSGDGFFDAVQLETPLDRRALYVDAVPHLYPLVRLEDEYPRYAAVMLEAHHARIYVFGLDTTPRESADAGPAPRHRAVGGWSQARFHRRAENLHLEPLDDVVETLDRIVVDENLRRIVVTGHDGAVPRLCNQLPARLSEKLVDVVRLDRHAGEGRLLHATLEALRAQDADAHGGNTAWMRDMAHTGAPIGYRLESSWQRTG
jgi:peptide subunit release factor 1 (eRF1)